MKASSPTATNVPRGAEQQRLDETAQRTRHWNRWGPFLSERQWGTVREDYSAGGDAWNYFTHDQARSRAYRWGEDGIAGICDRHALICFALALWNGHDAILKERLFGLAGPEGNHGEDVKEYYFYLDSTPTHSYMRYLYKYPQAAFPYARLVDENRRRNRDEPEFELIDTGVFDGDRYFDVEIEYAKAAPEDILVRIHVANRGPETAEIHVLPTLWFRNTWSWGVGERRPHATRDDPVAGAATIAVQHGYYGSRWLYAAGAPPLLFTNNETNTRRLFGATDGPTYARDGIDDFVVNGVAAAVNPRQTGTRAAAHYRLAIAAGQTVTLRLRLTDTAIAPGGDPFASAFDATVAQRRQEADEFYAGVIPADLDAAGRAVMRQALAGLLWSKQFYHYDVKRWLRGDVGMPEPPAPRLRGRNCEWEHLFNGDVISMPDKWEYPWYAAWDLAFHCVALALVDPAFAKQQLILMLREWFMHPNGQIPAYEWAFGDVNPPVHAWAAWRVYKIEGRRRGRCDRNFLERVFHKLLLNFTWWVNRKDASGRNIFDGGFLGLDNIGVFDRRSDHLPSGARLAQSDATSWMGMYCLNMMAIALELAREDKAYEDVASKFFEHFVYICRAMNDFGRDGIDLWDGRDGFYYDVLYMPGRAATPMRVRSMVGLIPLFAVETLEPGDVDSCPGFKRRLQWFIENRPELADFIEIVSTEAGPRRFLSLVNRARLRRVLRYMLDPNEFLSPHGIRSLSRVHRDHPYAIEIGNERYEVHYEPAESRTNIFGGNSNWRGPIWFPVNFLLIESLQKFDHFLGDEFRVEHPVGSGKELTLWEVATDLSRRLTRIFLPGEGGRRPVFGGTERFQTDPHWRDLIPFYEYFDGDTGAGLGASHQTGWTALVAKLLQQSGMERPAVAGGHQRQRT
ncbi:glucosidase [Candidatus Binatia bacterium]|nr:glucosidase [Candidatus Binatia bacterium]